MRLPRTLAGEALLALVFALFFATPAPAGSIIVTETHTHSFRPGDSSASALAYARWGAVERVLASGVRKLREAGALKAKATGHEEAMLGAVVVVEVEALECGKGS
ncbi:MAG: hypothetical protein KAR83_01990, partial [Thermodesulfovibrionales bacterium]|nr:hypothetical protein [Thermodesulfovibrionales bacterium]